MKIYRILGQIAGLLLIVTSATANEPGSDNPLVSRYSGATMHGYLEREYYSVSLPSGPIPGDAYRNRSGWDGEVLQAVEVPLEGRVTWITYQAPENKSTLEILRNYQDALAAGGYEVRFECADKTGCGRWIGSYVKDVIFPDVYWRQLRNALHPPVLVRGNTRALLAGREGDAGSAHVFLYIMDQQPQPVIHQVVVEGQPMQTGQVQTDIRSADELQALLTTEGKAIVDGIFFEYDSAEIRPESAEALAQMARLLEMNPGIEVLVVGHTDNQGGFDYNADLSLRRAAAVRQALASNYGIAIGRMMAKGASFMAPIASNASVAGRELNRRVELVLM